MFNAYTASMPPCAPYDGNRALYQDPNAEIYSQAPGGEVYAMADKRPKVVVEHLASPGGDLYAVADNKQPKRKVTISLCFSAMRYLNCAYTSTPSHHTFHTVHVKIEWASCK